MSNQELAARIIELIGGNSNISRAAHCMTRLRLNLYNNDLIQLKEIESLKGVLGAQMQNQQLQIIIGPQVGSLYNEIAAQANLNPAADAPKTNQKLFTRFLDILSGIFLPVIPAIAGAGMLKAIIALLKAANLVQVDSYTFQLFNMMADCISISCPFSWQYPVQRYLRPMPHWPLPWQQPSFIPPSRHLSVPGTLRPLSFSASLCAW